ncbi:MAG: hypothetical protein HN348_24880 [Proteobacteria bacterium]|nr:hypothetical protein [Pseudomonadota bacterium]
MDFILSERACTLGPTPNSILEILLSAHSWRGRDFRGRRATEADSKHRFPVLESRPTEPAGPGVNREFRRSGIPRRFSWSQLDTFKLKVGATHMLHIGRRPIGPALHFDLLVDELKVPANWPVAEQP